MRVILTAIGGVALALASVPAHADDPQIPDETFSRYDDALDGSHFDDALAIANGLSIRGVSEGRVAHVLSMRVAALIGLKREAEADKLIARIDHLPLEDETPWRLVMWGGIDANNDRFALLGFDRLIERYPSYVTEMSPKLVSYLTQRGDKFDANANDERRVRLARLRFGKDSYQDMYAGAAVRTLVGRGDVAGASSFLPMIDDIHTLQDMLVMRKFAPLWPALEKMVGPHFETVRSSFAERAKARFVQNPENAEILADYVRTLTATNHVDQAIALRSTLPMSAAGMSGITEERAWVVNAVAYALHRGGQKDEADRLFAMLIDAPSNDDASWKISMIINRLEFLVWDGKFDQASALLYSTASAAQADGNEYARQLVRRLRFCTLTKLKRDKAAADSRVEMLAHAGDAKEATIEGLLCANDPDEAERLALSWLADKDFQATFVARLQKVPLVNDDPSFISQNWTALFQRPKIADAFNQFGRQMPEALVFEPK